MAISARLEAEWLKGTELAAVWGALGPEDCRLVGGCVRDGLLGVTVSDIDLATRHRPDVVMKKAQAAGLKTVPTGLSHGTVTVIANSKPFEITTLREDVETDGRHAVV
ncbi:MAG: CCA tRNA nucleotidyltransferase, partial [Sphingomonadales bacterium]